MAFLVSRQPGKSVAQGTGQSSGFRRRQASHGVLTDRFVERLSNFRSFFGVPHSRTFFFHTRRSRRR